MYSMNNQCRVCALDDVDTVSKLDKDLLEGEDLSTLLYKYSGKFVDLEKPLTRAVLYTHRKHLRQSVPAAILGVPDMTAPTETPNVLAKDTRAEGFTTYLGSLEKEKEMIEILVDSAMDDLLKSDSMLSRSKSSGVKDESLVLSVRNQIRKALGEFITLNKEMVTPTVNLPIGDTNKKLFIEFLLIVKKAAELSIPDAKSKEDFLLEITTQIRKSKEFKFILQEERDRRDISENLDKEPSV